MHGIFGWQSLAANALVICLALFLFVLQMQKLNYLILNTGSFCLINGQIDTCRSWAASLSMTIRSYFASGRFNHLMVFGIYVNIFFLLLHNHFLNERKKYAKHNWGALALLFFGSDEGCFKYCF